MGSVHNMSMMDKGIIHISGELEWHIIQNGVQFETEELLLQFTIW